VVYRALRWDKNVWSGGGSIPTDLQTLVPGGGDNFKSYGYGINAGNRIVGKSVFDGTGAFHAFRTRANEVIVPGLSGNDDNDLGTIGGVTGPSEGLALNDRDEVVGASTNVINSVGVYHAFLKAPNSGKDAGFTDLGVLNDQSPAHDLSVAFAINNAGQVVGYSKNRATSDSDRAFIRQKGG